MNVLYKDRAIVLFDGYCNFCSGSVEFIIKRDPKKHFKFAAAQAEPGIELLKIYDIGELASHSIVLIMNNRIFSRSDAALLIARNLSGLWPLFYGFIILPRFVRDFFYNLIARNRYRIYGMRDQCFVPGPGMRERFISKS